MASQDLFFKLGKYIDTKIKEKLFEFIDIYQVVSYNEIDGSIKVRRLYEKVDENEDIIDSGKGYGDKKQISMGYEPGDILLIIEINGTKIILTSLFNQFFDSKDNKLIPKKGEMLFNCKNFNILNKKGYGVVCDENGKMTFHATEINFTQTPINMEYKQ